LYTRHFMPRTAALAWTAPFAVGFGVWSTAVTAAFALGGQTWLALPALPISILGTAVSFYLGFKGNASYDRLWEARKIWGGIVNTSRTWGTHVTAFIDNADDDVVHTELVYRHVAWLTALRIRLRRPKPWEHRKPSNDHYRKIFGTLDTSDDALRAGMAPFIDPAELDWLMARQNHTTQLIATQSRRLKELRLGDAMDDFRHMELAKLLETLLTLQGKAERIKNFPLPRQYATVNRWFVQLFLVLLPFGLLGSFESLGDYRAWLTVPITMILAWVFTLWDLLQNYSENPFEGLINDIPMTSMSRGIEIDLREILGETELPDAIKPVNDYMF
jgi:putative membrane protein